MAEGKGKGIPMNRTRINYNMPDDLLAMVDNYASMIGTSRTAVITFILRDFFDSRQALKTCNSVLDFVKENNKELPLI